MVKIPAARPRTIGAYPTTSPSRFAAYDSLGRTWPVSKKEADDLNSTTTTTNSKDPE